MAAPARTPSARLAWWAGALALLATATWCAGQTGGLAPSRVGELASAALLSGWLPALWMLAAVGWGRWVRRMVPASIDDAVGDAALTWSIGVCAQLIVVAWCGWLGVTAWMPPIGASLPLVIGLAGLTGAPRTMPITPPRTAWLIALAIPLGVLMTAASSAPGWLWQTEFGGYDALTYHLLLPREWLSLGRTMTLDHNVYSALPSFVEATYAQLFAFAPNPLMAGTTAQWLHAMMTVCAATACAGAARSVARQITDRVTTISAAGWCAAIVFVCTPWVIVCGSLAYSEMPTLIALGVVLILVVQRACGMGTVVMAAVACAAAIGAKGTALGTVAAPAAAVLVARVLAFGADAAPGVRTMVARAACGASIALVALMPWWVRNWVDAGQPLFPFAAALGRGQWWTMQQHDAFAAAHRSMDGASLTALWNEWFRFGVGEAPANGEPWRPQWMLMPWLGVTALVWMWLDRARRGAALTLTLMTVVGMGFWLWFTHEKSRFLLPTTVPLSAAVGAMFAWWVHGAPRPIDARANSEARGDAVAEVSTHVGRRRLAAVSALLLGMACAVPWWYAGDGAIAGAPAAGIGAEGVFVGTTLADDLRARRASDQEWTDTARDASPAFALNELLNDDDRVYTLGENRGWYCRTLPAYHTVWDRGPLERALSAGAAPADCVQVLHAAGITHLLVDHAMLARWRSSGWLDEGITDERVHALLGALDPVVRTAGGCTLHRLPSSIAPRNDGPDQP